MGKSVSRTLLTAMKNVNDPSWFSIIADEATYVFITKQFNLSVQWVCDYCEGHEDSTSLFRVPYTNSETPISVIKDLIRKFGRGQAYDEA